MDTDNLVKNQNELFKTEKTLCFFDLSAAVHLAIGSPKNSLLFRLYNEKNFLKDDQIYEKKILKKSRCLIPQDENLIYFLSKTSSLILVSDTELNFFLYLFQEFKLAKKIFYLTKGQFNFFLIFLCNLFFYL